ncbi:MAG: urea transporter [Crocinitomicaceae bacterium]|nr:urea transporter [Crocinitomicaceae bacterium]
MELREYLTATYSKLLDPVLKGIGQIMLRESTVSGLLILSGIFYGSVSVGIAVIISSACGTITALLFKFNKADINKGLYGFSAALVGAGVITFFKPDAAIWFCIVTGSVIAALIQHFFLKRNLPVFTLPFVLATWIIYYLLKYYYPDAAQSAVASIPATVNNFDFALKSFGQVIFQNNSISGVLFFLAVFIVSPISALYGLSSAIFAAIISPLFPFSSIDMNNGLLGFNVVLCAIVFAGTHIKDSIWVIVSCALSLLFTFVLLKYEIVQLTFPFAISSFIISMVKKNFVSIKI